MRSGKKALIGVGLVAVAAVATLLLLAPGGDSNRAAALSVRIQHPVHPELRPASGVTRSPVLERSTPGEEQQGKRKSKNPYITDLVTTGPVTVDAGASRIAVLSCGRSQGIALDGGVIGPPAPAQVVVTMLSRANPNPPYANSRRNYYVGVRNLDPVTPASFHATLVCAKRIDVR